MVLVSEHSDSNKMTSGNISIVFGPNILYKHNKDEMDIHAQASAMSDQKDVANVVQLLIEKYDDIFSVSSLLKLFT
jgi:hypothetical protein